MKYIFLFLTFFTGVQTLIAQTTQENIQKTFPDSLLSCKCPGHAIPEYTFFFTTEGTAIYTAGAVIKCFGKCADHIYFQDKTGWREYILESTSDKQIYAFPHKGFCYFSVAIPTSGKLKYYKYIYDTQTIQKKTYAQYAHDCHGKIQ